MSERTYLLVSHFEELERCLLQFVGSFFNGRGSFILFVREDLARFADKLLQFRALQEIFYVKNKIYTCENKIKFQNKSLIPLRQAAEP